MSTTIRDNILLSGCYRSGTTLLDKLLHNHPNVVLASQAYPVLFYYVKQQFLDQRSLSRRYPLEHLFREQDYSQADWYAFLDSYEISERDIEYIFDGLSAYSHGVWTPEVLELRQSITSGKFIDVLKQFNQGLYSIFPDAAASVVGTKEIMVEEFIPYLLDHEIRVVLVIRDPRAMIASVHFSEKHYMGEHRPILYSLRNWRKSVAFALGYQEHPLFNFLRYEDLVSSPKETLSGVTCSLELPDLSDDFSMMDIKDQYGNVWSGNSSFEQKDGINRSSIDVYKKRVPADVLHYIEQLTYPELKALGYPCAPITSMSQHDLEGFKEPFSSVHDKFPGDYSCNEARISDEITRFKLLLSPKIMTDVDDIRSWFISEITYNILHNSLES